jgi:DNA-binding MarR family transcriptional regulator
VLVEITETGKAILKQAEDVQKEVIARGLSQLPPDEMRILVSAFEKLTNYY